MKLLDAPRSRLPWIALLLVGVLLASVPAAAEDPAPSQATEAPAPYALPADFVKRMATLPVQDGGRVKPFSSWAAFTLMQINAKRSMTTLDGRKLGPVEWALETMFFPERAVEHPVFFIEDDQVLAGIGIKIDDEERKRRKLKRYGRYTYSELKPRLRLLEAKVAQVTQRIQQGRMRERDQTAIQRHERQLYGSVKLFRGVLHCLDILREEVDVSGLDDAKWFEGRARVSLVEAFVRLPALLVAVHERAGALDPGALDPDKLDPEKVDPVTRVTAEIRALLRHKGTTKTAFSVLPPDHTDTGEFDRWLAPGNIGVATFLDPLLWSTEEVGVYGPVRHAVGEHLAHLQGAHAQRDDSTAFVTHLEAFRASVTELAKRRGEYDFVESEVSYYRFEPFYKALLVYILAFIVLAFSWYFTNSKWLYRAAVSLIVLGLLLITAGITWRSIIRQLPPISTLYDTIPFIAGSGILACLVIERINRQRIAIVLAAVFGVLGMWLENRYQVVVDRRDTMPMLPAVLRTNFWLSTHVTTINVGYAAGALAAGLAHVHVLGRVFGLKRNDPGFYRTVARMIYGTVCFTLLFAVVGTILGGVWANDSWGRFWGWDPKENGALLICLWCTAILHGRMGGYIRDHGVAMAGVFTGPVVAFSWFGVNQLQVGLHTYGHIDGIETALFLFYWFEAAVLVSGGVWWLLRLNDRAKAGPQ